MSISTAVDPRLPPVQGNFAVAALSAIVGIGVGVLTAEFGPVIAGAAGMAAANATGALLNGLLAGHSTEQIVCDTLTAGAIGAVAGAAGGLASMLMAPAAAGLAGALGLTCENGLGALGAFIIGAGDGAAFGAASSFVQTALVTGDLNQALDAGLQGALWGGLIGGVASVGLNAINQFVCFTAGTQVHKAVGIRPIESENVG